MCINEIWLAMEEAGGSGLWCVVVVVGGSERNGNCGEKEDWPWWWRRSKIGIWDLRRYLHEDKCNVAWFYLQWNWFIIYINTIERHASLEVFLTVVLSCKPGKLGEQRESGASMSIYFLIKLYWMCHKFMSFFFFLAIKYHFSTIFFGHSLSSHSPQIHVFVLWSLITVWNTTFPLFYSTKIKANLTSGPDDSSMLKTFSSML